MPTENRSVSPHEFHEVHQKQQQTISSSSSIVVGQPSSNAESASRQRIRTAWSTSSLSSSSSVSTGSLFSLMSDSSRSSRSRRYKTTGIFFGNLDRVATNRKVDPKPYACYNCWHFDHKFSECPYEKIHNYCRNCGRRGVSIKQCPRCARAYIDYVDQLCVKVVEPMDDVQLNVIEERSNEDRDTFVESDDHKCIEASFSDSAQKAGGEYQQDDWDEYQSPRLNMIEKSIKVYSLNAKKAEVAKYKDESWSDCEMASYSYSWTDHSNKINVGSFNISEEKVEDKIQDYDEFKQDACQDLSLDRGIPFKSYIYLENEGTKYESSYWSNHNKDLGCESDNMIISNETKVENIGESWSDCIDCAVESLSESSTGMCEATDLISGEKENLMDQNYWNEKNNADVFKRSEENFVIELKEHNVNIHQKKEEWNDSEAYQSFQASFVDEELETENYMKTLDTLEEEYWTDFDDDYNSLQASFAEDYKSLNNTADDESDGTNIFGVDKLNSEENSEFYDSLYVFASNQGYGKKAYPVNSLESSVCSQSDEANLSNNEDADDYESMIVDENERSEPTAFVGQAVQEFLHLLDSLKHLPIQTQNIAVLHFISKQKEQSWHQEQMQNRM